LTLSENPAYTHNTQTPGARQFSRSPNRKERFVKKPLSIAICLALLCGVSSLQSPAQIGSSVGNVLTGKKKPPSVSQLANLTENDKERVAKIEATPEIQRAIQEEWDETRRADLQMAYSINLTENWGVIQDNVRDDSFDRQRLYSNPIVQSFVNHLGQRLIPKGSVNTYTFRVLYDPIPKVLTLSTGTVYVSTGMLAVLDNESELSYVLAHEIAHVEKRQAWQRIHDKIVGDELDKEKAEKEKMITDVATTVLGVGAGGMLIPLRGAGSLLGGLAGGTSGLTISHYFIHPHLEPTKWETQEEDEADELSARYMMDQGYDPRESLHVYSTLEMLAQQDSRVGLGFIGDPKHVKERETHLQTMMDGPLRAEISGRAKDQKFVGNGREFTPMLAMSKRDNGILAMDFDLFTVAKKNLQDAIGQRPNDPTAHFYLAKLERETARTPEERQDALNHLTNALNLDSERGAIPAAHLEYAVELMEQDAPADQGQVTNELKAYVALYDRDRQQLPGNMNAVYDYLNDAGDAKWYLPAPWYTATQLGVGSTTIAADAVIRRATNTAPVIASPGATPVSTPGGSKAKPKATAKPASTTTASK
jgi:predicted Zn-dependent protease